MEITDHSYANGDAEYEAIKAFLLQVKKLPDVDDNWDPGRLDWWRYNVHAAKGVDFFAANAHYWRADGGRVVGLFISEYGESDFFLVVHPDLPALFSEVLNWGFENWAPGRGKIGTPVFTCDREKIERLEAAGLYEDGQESNVRSYDLRDYDFSYSLQPGFALLSFPEYGNYDSRVRLVHRAFGNLAYSETNLHSLQSSPTYRAELDLVVVDDRGESVAYCMGWVEEYDPKVGYIEPMGTHPDYRRKGLATGLAKECFKRLRGMGVERAEIASEAEPNISNFLYESLRPTGVKKAYMYSLDPKMDHRG